MSMLTCKEFIEFLDDYVAGAQESPVRTEFERHLAVCPDCVTYLRTYQHTIALARSTRLDPTVPAPADAPAELITAILAARAKEGGRT